MRKLFRNRVEEAPPLEGIWQVPPRFNYTRDVIEAYAADPLYPALTYVDRNGVIDRRTFTEIAREANRWAALLRNRGLQPGDRLLIFTAKNPTWVAILLGALKAGMVAVPCSEGVQTGELAWRAEDSGARLIVTDRERAAAVALMDVPLDVVVAEEAATELRKTPILQPTHDTAAEDVAVILYTSKAGVQIGVTHTHGSTWAQRVPAEHWLEARPGDLVWCTSGPGRCGVRLEPPPRAVGMWRRARDPRGLLRPRTTPRSPATARRHDPVPDARRLPAPRRCRPDDRPHPARPTPARGLGGRAERRGSDQRVPGCVRDRRLGRLRANREHHPRREHARRHGQPWLDRAPDPRSRDRP